MFACLYQMIPNASSISLIIWFAIRASRGCSGAVEGRTLYWHCHTEMVHAKVHYCRSVLVLMLLCGTVKTFCSEFIIHYYCFFKFLFNRCTFFRVNPHWVRSPKVLLWVNFAYVVSLVLYMLHTPVAQHSHENTVVASNYGKLSSVSSTLPGPSASKVMTLWRCTNVFIIFIIIKTFAVNRH